MANIRTRKDVWKLGEWDDTLVWYAKAVAEMQKRPINDPLSWRYQAAIHDYTPQKGSNGNPVDQLPSTQEQERFWRQCQHASWFFLPWHRMYLGFFEQIVAATVRQLGGPQDWALPYWNYSDSANPNARRLPPAFRAVSLPDGTVNPLRVKQRAPWANGGEEVADAEDVDIKHCLKKEFFTAASTGGDPGFGGPTTVFTHSGRNVGDLERSPHGSIHVDVGGAHGWMSAFNTAALDPLFWLHHANIDRIWSVWLARDQHHSNPTDSQWLTSISFEFHDANREEVSMTASQVIDTAAPPLLYDYEDISDPLGAPPREMEAVVRSGMKDRPIPEMVGATDQAVTLTGETASTTLPVNKPTGPASSGRESAPAPPKHIFLNIENITGSENHGGYSVYLNLPPGANPDDHHELRAGVLPMFGVAESTEASSNHPGDGLFYTLEITDVVKALEAKNAWNPDEMQVTFVPKRRQGGREAGAVNSPVQVGRVSLYYS